MPALVVERGEGWADAILEHALPVVWIGLRNTALAGYPEDVVIAGDGVHGHVERLQGFYIQIEKLFGARILHLRRVRYQVAAANSEVRLDGVHFGDALRAAVRCMELGLNMKIREVDE